MVKKVLPVQGVIVPDLSYALTYIKLCKSSADMMLQLEKEDNPNAYSGHFKYRTIRRVDKYLHGDGDLVSRQDLKKTIKLLCDTFEWEKNNYKIKLSDFRNFGHWGILKGLFIPYRNSSNFEHLWPLSDYVFALCEEEKNYIARLRNESGMDFFIKIIRQKFCIDNSLCDAVHKDLLLVESLDNYYEVTRKNHRFFGALVIHQHLFMAAILEQYFYTYYRFEDSKFLLERKVIKRVLPSIDNNKFIGSISKLITKIFKESKYQTKEKFYEGLSELVHIDTESVERKITRWNTGESSVSPNEFNELFKSVVEVPHEIIIACSISDNLSRELMDQGISAEWIVKEFSKYPKYQSEIIEACS